MKYERTEDKQNVTIKLYGDIDLYNAPELKAAIAPEQGRCLILDCSMLDYIDSTGLGVLVSTLKSSKDHGGAIRITGLKPHLYRLFELTALDKIFEIEVAK